jgi:hypothetical protein
MAAALPLCLAAWLGEASGAETARAMRVIFTTEGGVSFFPGLSQPVTIDAAALTQEERNELERLIDEAGFFALPGEAGKPAKGAADYRQYTITVEEQGRLHTVKASDPLGDPKLRNLIGFLQRKARELRKTPKP